MKKPDNGKDNFLDLVPVHDNEWDENGDGGVYLLVPRFRNKWMKKVAARLGKSEFVKVSLDANGTKAWKLMDGNRSVAEIARQVGPEADENMEQSYDRLADFISILARNKFVQLKNL